MPSRRNHPRQKPPEPKQGALVVRRVSLDELYPDPDNARKHDDRNLQAISDSLNTFGQVEPLVVEKGTGRVLGGNGRLAAMRASGVAECDVVEVDIHGLKASALSIALNRTAELAEWDEERLVAAFEQFREEPDFEPDAIGFSDAEIAALIDKAGAGGDEEEKAEPKNFASAEKWMVVVECRDEAHQVELLARFQAEGLEASPIVS